MKGLRPTLLLIVLSLIPSTASAPRPVPTTTALAPMDVVADGLDEPIGVAVDEAGTIFVSEAGSGRIIRLTVDGHRTVFPVRFDHPIGLAIAPQGQLLIVEQGRGRLWRLEPTGATTLLASRIRDPRWIAAAGNGTIYISAAGLERDPGGHQEDGEVRSRGEDHEDDKSDVILSLGPDGTLGRFAEGFTGVQGIAVTASAVYAVVERVLGHGDRADGLLIRIAIHADGTAGPLEILAQSATRDLTGLALDRLGAAFFGGGRPGEGKDDDERGDGRNEGTIEVWRAGHSLVTFAAGLEAPRGLAFEAAGNLLVAVGDHDAGRLLRFRAPAAPVLTAPAFTNQSPVSVTGHADPGDLVTAFRDDDFTTALVTATAQAPEGAFTVAIPLNRNGKNQLAVTATSAGGVGLTSSPAEVTIVHDDVPPTVAVLQPQRGVFVRQVIQVQASAADSGSGVASVSALLDAKAIGALANPDPTKPLTATFNVDTRNVPDGTHTLTVSAADRAGNIATTAVTVIVDNTPPHTQITSAPPAVITGTTVTVTFNGTDNLTSTQSLVFAWRLDGGEFTPFSSATTATLTGLAPGSHTFEVKARDLTGNEDPTPATAVFRVNVLPTIGLQGAPLSGAAPLTVTFTATAADPDGDPLTVTWNFGDGTTATGTGPQTHRYQNAGSFTAIVTVSDGFATAQATVIVTVAAGGGGVPPDPKTVAPPIDPTVATSLKDATNFLYTGANPIQTGVAPGTIDPVRVAVLRGRVLDRNNVPLPGVTITVLNHPEFGQTQSRADGMFDMAVNGGGPLTVNYGKNGFLPAHRTLDSPWQRYLVAPDVVLIALDSQVTAIALGASTMQIARGSVVTDADGTRQATILFPAGIQASLVMPDGSVQPANQVHVRATEYTVGPNGPAAMPGDLPPTSFYTSALEYSVDEALVAGATAVTFNPRVIEYIENFLGFPVGGPVPSGFYDRIRGVWVPGPTGRIVKILSVNAGSASLDIDGSGTPANSAALTALGVTSDELRQLALLYPAGQTLWRTPMDHFSGWDRNWGFGPPPDAQPPAQQPRPSNAPPDDCDCENGSIIQVQGQLLDQVVGVTGTDYLLRYTSARAPGRKANSTVSIPVSGSAVPASLKRIELDVSVAGRTFSQTFTATPNQTATFTWDGLDAYGRTVQGRQSATITIGYVYDGFYKAVDRFGYNGNGIPIVGSRARREVTLLQTQTAAVGSLDAAGDGLGGWTLSVHHTYDPLGRTLYQGDGVRRSVQNINGIITTVAGTGQPGFSGDGGPATQAQLNGPWGVGVGPDGSLYIGDTSNNRIRKVDPSGIVTTFAGTGAGGFGGDNSRATQAMLNFPTRAQVGRDGSIYIDDRFNNRVRRVGPDGIMTTFAGTGVAGFNGDEGPATQARLNADPDPFPARDGTVYISDINNHRVRRVGTDGIITTVAGTGFLGFSGDGGPAAQARFFFPTDLAIAADGTVYITDSVNNRIRKVAPDGTITTIAGGGSRTDDNILGPQAALNLSSGADMAIGSDGALYFSERNFHRIRRLSMDGILTTIAGNGTSGFSGDGGPATQAQISNPFGIGVGPGGEVYFGDAFNHRVRKIAPPLPGFRATDIAIPSADGSQLFQFDSTGRHQRTVHALTGATLYAFAYDANGRLTQVTDESGNVTTIQRDDTGNPTAIVAPFGQATALTVDANGHLAAIADPAGNTYQVVYTANGLMTSFTDPRGNAHTFSYDALGRLTKDQAPNSGFTALARADAVNGYTVTTTSALNRTTSSQVTQLPNGDERRLNTDPAGLQTSVIKGANGVNTTTSPDGMIDTETLTGDPRWGMQAPIAKSTTSTTPAGLTLNSLFARSVTLLNPTDPLSVSAQNETLTLNGLTYTSNYSAPSRTFTLTTPAGRQATTTIDARGRPIQRQFANLNPSSFTYDPRGRLSTVVSGTGASARSYSYTYNADGYLASVTDPLSHSTSFLYDAAGRVTQKMLPDGRVITFGYDADGNLTSLTPPGRPAHTFAFTPVDLTSSYTAPNVGVGNQTLYAYNVDRQVTTITRPDAQTLTFAYDTAGRLGTLTIPDGQSTYAYSGTGNLAGITAPDGGTLSYSYDGELLTGMAWAGAVTGSISHTYDNFFRLTSESIDGGNTINFKYDNDGLLTGAGALTFTRDAQNGLITTTNLGGVTDTRTYDNFAEVTHYTAAFGGSSIFDVQYTYDQLGRITEKTETISGRTTNFAYTYDQAGRLIAVLNNTADPSVTYAYDSNSNRLSVTSGGVITNATYDAQDRLTQYGLITYRYTANGELANKTVGGRTTRYEYDVVGNLRSITLATGAQIAYVTDGQNRRIGKKVNGTLIQGFLYKGIRPVAELDGGNNLVSRFVYGARSNVPDYIIKGGNTYRIISDHLGSPRLVVDVNSGAVVQNMDYDEFGNVLTDTNPGFQPFGFAGGLYDGDTGLVRFGARDYDPASGRWTVKDPILLAGDTNLYGYAEADPVNFIDPTGTKTLSQLLCDLLKQLAKKTLKKEAERRGREAGDRTVDKQRRGLSKDDQRTIEWWKRLSDLLFSATDFLGNLLGKGQEAAQVETQAAYDAAAKEAKSAQEAFTNRLSDIFVNQNQGAQNTRR